jgi:hypothetical protein
MKAFVLALLVALSIGGPALASPQLPGAPTIKLLDAGKGAKKALRFTAKKGMKRSLTVTMEMGLAMTIGAQAVPAQKLPATRLTMDLVVTSVAPNGDIRYEFVTRKPEVVADRTTPPFVVDAMNKALAELEGLSGHAVVTNRGFSVEADVKVPEKASAQTQQMLDSIRQSLAQIAAPVPEEPVGVGATWETITKLQQNGLVIEQTATNELVAMKGKTITLKIKVAQTAQPQKFTANGVTADLESYSASGHGQTTLGLTNLVPTKAQMSLTSDMRLEAQGQKLDMSLDLAVTIKGE